MNNIKFALLAQALVSMCVTVHSHTRGEQDRIAAASQFSPEGIEARRLLDLTYP
jgi:hypothetical protein